MEARPLRLLYTLSGRKWGEKKAKKKSTLLWHLPSLIQHFTPQQEVQPCKTDYAEKCSTVTWKCRKLDIDAVLEKWCISLALYVHQMLLSVSWMKNEKMFSKYWNGFILRRLQWTQNMCIYAHTFLYIYVYSHLAIDMWESRSRYFPFMKADLDTNMLNISN